MRTALLVLCGVLLSACVADKVDPLATTHALQAPVAPTMPTTPPDVTSPTVPSEQPPREYTLVSWLAPEGDPLGDRFQLQIKARFAAEARLAQTYGRGAPIETVVISRVREDCACAEPVVEMVGINLTEAQMIDSAERDLAFELSGEALSMMMSVPKTYFAGHLKLHKARKAEKTS